MEYRRGLRALPTINLSCSVCDMVILGSRVFPYSSPPRP